MSLGLLTATKTGHIRAPPYETHSIAPAEALALAEVPDHSSAHVIALLSKMEARQR